MIVATKDINVVMSAWSGENEVKRTVEPSGSGIRPMRTIVLNWRPSIASTSAQLADIITRWDR